MKKDSLKELNFHMEEIKHLCASLGIRALFAFGSATRNDLSANSDIDLVVDIDDADPFSYSDKYFELKFNLERIFNRKIDLLEQKAIRNRFLKKEIDQTKYRIYAA